MSGDAMFVYCVRDVWAMISRIHDDDLFMRATIGGRLR